METIPLRRFTETFRWKTLHVVEQADKLMVRALQIKHQQADTMPRRHTRLNLDSKTTRLQREIAQLTKKENQILREISAALARYRSS